MDFPTVQTGNVNYTTETTAVLSGLVISDGGSAVTARGTCWSTSPNPTIALPTKTTNGSGAGGFTSNITGLIAGTTYFARAYATNSTGTVYGNHIKLTIPAALQYIDNE